MCVLFSSPAGEEILAVQDVPENKKEEKAVPEEMQQTQQANVDKGNINSCQEIDSCLKPSHYSWMVARKIYEGHQQSILPVWLPLTSSLGFDIFLEPDPKPCEEEEKSENEDDVEEEEQQEENEEEPDEPEEISGKCL